MARGTSFRKRTHATRSIAAAAAGGGGCTACVSCGSGESPSDLVLCDNCDSGFHLFCLRPILSRVPPGSWFCPSCSSSPTKPQRFPLVQTKILDFFRITRGTEVGACLKRKRRTAGAGALVVVKKKRRLLPYKPSEEHGRRMEQMASLATALMTTGAKFSNELTYRPGMAPRSANCASIEKGGMQILCKEDSEALNLCMKMMERGECPPLLVVYDPLEGFTVEADRFIKDLTIITKYVGDVDYLRNREHDDIDSMMTLIYALDPSRSLVICPDKLSNIARFINGINNHTPEGKKKQNLKCVRYSVDGESRVLLVANRDIAKGERLYYDYNGYEQEYPTQHFV